MGLSQIILLRISDNTCASRAQTHSCVYKTCLNVRMFTCKTVWAINSVLCTCKLKAHLILYSSNKLFTTTINGQIFHTYTYKKTEDYVHFNVSEKKLQHSLLFQNEILLTYICLVDIYIYTLFLSKTLFLGYFKKKMIYYK